MESRGALLQNGSQDTGSDGRPDRFNSQALASQQHTGGCAKWRWEHRFTASSRTSTSRGISMGSADNMTEGRKESCFPEGRPGGERWKNAGRLRTYGGTADGRRVLCAWGRTSSAGQSGRAGEAQTAVLMSGDSGFTAGRRSFCRHWSHREQMKGRRGGHNPCRAGISSLSISHPDCGSPGRMQRFLSCHGKRDLLAAGRATGENLCPDGRAEPGNLR